MFICAAPVSLVGRLRDLPAAPGVWAGTRGTAFAVPNRSSAHWSGVSVEAWSGIYVVIDRCIAWTSRAWERIWAKPSLRKASCLSQGNSGDSRSAVLLCLISVVYPRGRCLLTVSTPAQCVNNGMVSSFGAQFDESPHDARCHARGGKVEGRKKVLRTSPVGIGRKRAAPNNAKPSLPSSTAYLTSRQRSRPMHLISSPPPLGQDTR